MSAMTALKPPDACQSMAELRQQIDAIDVDLVTLLATRARYIDRAVALKKSEGMPARVTDRVAEVLDRVSAAATAMGLDPALTRTVWTDLIEWSIQRELKDLPG